MSRKAIGKKLRFEVFQSAKVNSEESVEFLKKFDVDLFVVVSFGQILSKAVLAIP